MELSLARILSPEARRVIIKMLISEMSYRELASQLGVTPAAIYKYVTGKAVPRDEIVARAISLVEDKAEVSAIIGRELARIVGDYIEWTLSHGVLDRVILENIETMLARASLVTAASRSDRLP